MLHAKVLILPLKVEGYISTIIYPGDKLNCPPEKQEYFILTEPNNLYWWEYRVRADQVQIVDLNPTDKPSQLFDLSPSNSWPIIKDIR